MSKRTTQECQSCSEYATVPANGNTVTLYQCKKEARLNKPNRWEELEKPKMCVKQ